MPRYYFSFRWPDDAVTDTEGVELENFADAYATPVDWCSKCVGVSLTPMRVGGSKSAMA